MTKSIDVGLCHNFIFQNAFDAIHDMKIYVGCAQSRIARPRKSFLEHIRFCHRKLVKKGKKSIWSNNKTNNGLRKLFYYIYVGL